MLIGEHDSLDDQLCRVEVEEQSDAEPGCFEVRLDLCEMDVFERLDGLELNDDLAFDDQVEPMNAHFFAFKIVTSCCG